MKIAIITAMPEELRAVRRLAKKFNFLQIKTLKCVRFFVAADEIVLVESGMGSDNARTTAELLAKSLKPDLIISAGFCGGISPELFVGDVLLAEKLIFVDNGELSDVYVKIPAISDTFFAALENRALRIFTALFASSKGILLKSELAKLLSADNSYQVVEMESAAIATVATKYEIPFIGIRTVSDAFDEELRFSLDEFCDQQMRIRPSKVIMTSLCKPRIIPQLIRLAINRKVAEKNLSIAFEELLAALQIKKQV